MIARSQSPLAAVNRAVTSPPAGIVIRFCATPAPVRSPLVHDPSTALAAETVCESRSAAEAGPAVNSTTRPARAPTPPKSFMAPPCAFQRRVFPGSSKSLTQCREETCARNPRETGAVNELGWRRRHAGPAATAQIGLDSLRQLGGAPVGLEALEVEPESPGPLPEMWVVEMALVLQQRVVHLPEAVLRGRRLRGRGEHPRARVLRCHREVPEDARDRQLLQDQVCLGAVRALKVRVLDDHRALAARVVGGPGLRRGCAAPARQR